MQGVTLLRFRLQIGTSWWSAADVLTSSSLAFNNGKRSSPPVTNVRSKAASSSRPTSMRSYTRRRSPPSSMSLRASSQRIHSTTKSAMRTTGAKGRRRRSSSHRASNAGQPRSRHDSPPLCAPTGGTGGGTGLSLADAGIRQVPRSGRRTSLLRSPCPGRHGSPTFHLAKVARGWYPGVTRRDELLASSSNQDADLASGGVVEPSGWCARRRVGPRRGRPDRILLPRPRCAAMRHVAGDAVMSTVEQ